VQQIFLQDVFADKIGWRKWARVIIYHVLGWGIPFVCMVIPTAAGKIGFEPGATLYVLLIPPLSFPKIIRLMNYLA